ncbi:DoxX family protein [Cohnella silvisoli]|uniref:DoxX family protein n=1 Tax=Cohnella silvisoli TaxID=2873699 RepID=A0ABV1KS38_9BACL|nr:DoxX family protein [Cohnella silvisoli]
MKKSIRIAGWIVVGVTSLFFVQSGIQKLAGTEQMVNLFQKLDYPDWCRIGIGLLEIAGAVVLAFPRLTLYAAEALGVLMIGAVMSEVTAGHGFGGGVLPGQWLIVLALIAGVRIRFISQSKAKERSKL